MSSACISQRSYQQQNHYQMMLLQQQQLHQQQQHLQLIAPAAPKTKILGNSNLQNVQPSGSAMLVLPKKKYTYTAMPYGQQPLASVERRNQRERNRVKQVNNGYSNLRQHIPQTIINTLSNGGRGASKKLSKVDTLRIAVEYIRGLQQMLDKSESSESNSTMPTTTTLRRVYDDSSNDDSNYDFASTNEDVQQFHQPAHSEASASPTPSYSDSDLSTGGMHYFQPLKLEIEPEQVQQQQQQQQEQHQDETEFKFAAHFQNYAQLPIDDENPDDEEVLKFISMWQQE